jgi:hypothetical protein
MKRILLATAAVLAATVAQAETIYVTPGSAVHFSTKRPFKTAISGDEELLVVHASATNQDLLIVANQPDGTLTASANVLMIDDQGKLVENLHVIVTPCGGPDTTVRVVGPSKNTVYRWCANGSYIDASAAKARKKGMGDADSLTETRNKDGSTQTTKQWSTPPTPPN